MFHNRRSFIKATATVAGGLVLQQLTGCSSSAKLPKEKKPFGLQLYTLRNEMANDPMGTLKKVSEFGYKQIESFEGAGDMFWGMGNQGFKRYMDELGMTIVSSHCNISKDFEKKAEEAAAIGMKYLINPGDGNSKTIDDFKKVAEVYNEKGEICKKAGLRFAYHNHELTFTPINGQFPQDVLMQNTNKDSVDYEMDIYWVVAAGQSPMEWMNRYPDRFRLYHVKDRKKDVPLTTRAAFTTLGTGGIDFIEITKLAEKNGNPYYIVEQDQSDIGALEAVRRNAEYLKNVIMPKL